MSTKGKGRDGGDRATPKATSSQAHDSPSWPSIRRLLFVAALAIQRFDAALIGAALSLAGWPR